MTGHRGAFSETNRTGLESWRLSGLRIAQAKLPAGIHRQALGAFPSFWPGRRKTEGQGRVNPKSECQIPKEFRIRISASAFFRISAFVIRFQSFGFVSFQAHAIVHHPWDQLPAWEKEV